MSGRADRKAGRVRVGIVGFSDLARPLIPAGSPAEKFVGEIAKVGQRGIALTKQLHQLSRACLIFRRQSYLFRRKDQLFRQRQRRSCRSHSVH